MSQLITCPECSKHLQVPDNLIGKKVQCPECKHTFTAAESAPTEVVSSAGTTASKPKPSAASTPSSAAKKKASWETDDDEEEDTRSRKSKPPTKRRRDNDDDDDDDDDYDDRRSRSRSRRRSSYGDHYIPHRGGMILAFGIIALASFVLGLPLALIFGPMAWFMGNSDMAEIRAGRMDPSGESQIQTGRVLGIISTLICALGLLVVFGCCFLALLAPALQHHG